MNRSGRSGVMISMQRHSGESRKLGLAAAVQPAE
jgi:hypothetical protein